MYKFKLVVKDSKIEGKGSFADEEISKGSIVWEYKEGYDRTMSQEEFSNLSDEDQAHYERIAYLSPTSNLWVFSPENDPGNYVNHHPEDYNLDTVVDLSKSPEPMYVANRDIKKGEELMSNYLEFDKFTIETRPEWA